MNIDYLKSKILEAKNAEESHNYFSAALHYKEALEIADKLQEPASIKLCKAKLVEMNKKTIESGDVFKKHEFIHRLSEEDQTSIKNFIVGILKINDKDKVLRIIGKHPQFMPNLKAVEKEAKNSIPITYQIASLTIISNEGHAVRGGSIGSHAWFMEMYKLKQELILFLCLTRLMYMLINQNTYQKVLSLSDVFSYFEKSKIIPLNKLRIVSTGLERYFAEDYVSTIHILVPQFEALILHIAQNSGINTVSLDKKKKDIATKTITLSDTYLDTEEFKKLFGENFCQQIKFVLFEPLGYKIRHKIAHGEIAFDECNFQNATLVLYLYLALLARIKVITK